MKQVISNTESTERQYALKNAAIKLGWQQEQIHTIDCDQGKSGAESDREGFVELSKKVSIGDAGIVMGLEVSRLARNSTDWHRLIEICALTNTLILDEEGVYDPSHFNDRLLLGLKGTMSEAELHLLRARLRGGIINKAKRGEYKIELPVGFIYTENNKVILDPDKRVQDTIRLFFKTFERVGSARMTLREFHDKKIKFPIKSRTTKEIQWGDLKLANALSTLHNPRYAGIYTFGRTRLIKAIKNRKIKLPKEQWQVYLVNQHTGYISEEQFETNEKRLQENATNYDVINKAKRPPREGTALLQGIATCGKCGKGMTVRYYKVGKELIPYYNCMLPGDPYMCQGFSGRSIDEEISKLVVKLMTPKVIKTSLNVQKEIESEIQKSIDIRRQHVDRLSYEVELARRRYLHVDPENRLVADNLEAEWNQKLRDLNDAQAEYKINCEKDKMMISSEMRGKILALAKDFPKIWKDAETPHRERKRLLQLLIEDVTLLRIDSRLQIGIRFRGGKSEILFVPAPINNFVRKRTKPTIVKEIDQLLDDCIYEQIAKKLTEKGYKKASGKLFTNVDINRIRLNYKLKTRIQRLREKGLLTSKQMAKKYRISLATLQELRNEGIVKVQKYGGGMGDFLYELPQDPHALEIINKRTVWKAKHFSN